jgi:hypothetical protein
LAQKKEYDIAEMLQKQDTMLEGMVVEAINQGDDLREDFSFEKYKNLRFSLEFDPEEEIQIGDDMYVTNMYFAVNEEKKQRERNRS